MATHSSILAWRIPWMEEPSRLQSTSSQSLTRLSNFTFLSFFPSFKRESCTKAPVDVLHIPLEGSSKPGHKNMGSREEPNWLLSVKGAGQGEAHVWVPERPDSSTSARNCSESPRSPGLGAGLSSSLHKSLRGKTKKTDIYFP